MNKMIFLISVTLASALFSNLFADTKKVIEEKPMTINSHVVNMLLDGHNMYRLELREYAAVYRAEEKFVSCLQQSIKENKKVTLIVSSQSLIVKECKI